MKLPFLENNPPRFLFQLAMEKVHGRHADEAGDEAVDGALIRIQRRVGLLNDAILHHHDPVAQRHRLFLIVGDVDGRGLKALVQSFEFGARRDAQLRIEVGERLIEQEHGRVAHDGPADGHALALAAGEGFGLAIEQVVNIEDAGGIADAAFDFGLGKLAQFQAERHVFVDRHVRVQGVVLKDHRYVAVLGGDMVDDALADGDGAAADLLETRNHAQGGALSAAGGTDEDNELSITDVEADAIDGLDVAGINLGDAGEGDSSHGRCNTETGTR